MPTNNGATPLHAYTSPEVLILDKEKERKKVAQALINRNLGVCQVLA